MLRVALLALLALTVHAASCPASATPRPEVRLTAAQAEEEIALVGDAIRRAHAGYQRYLSEEAFERMLFDWVRMVQGQGITADAHYVALSRLLARMRCAHTKAELPRALTAWRRANPSHLPFDYKIFGERLFVDAVAPGAGVQRGDEILSVDGEPVPRLIRTLGALISVDGFTDSTRAASLERDSEYGHAGFDHFLSLVHGPRSRFALELVRQGAPVRVEVAAISRDARARLMADPPARDFEHAVRYTPLDARTAALRIDTFVNYRTRADVEALFDAHFARMKAEGVERLILDLRRSGGGSTEVPVRLLQRVSPTPFVFLEPSVMRSARPAAGSKHVQTWDPDALRPPIEQLQPRALGGVALRPRAETLWTRAVEPSATRFDGEIIALIGPRNGSGATFFLARLAQLRPDARLVGQPTGGSAEASNAGVLMYLDLPHSGIRVRVPLMRQTLAGPPGRLGAGVEPQVWVEPTIEDWREGRDPVMAAARALPSARP